MNPGLARKWWAVTLRGGVAMLFGVALVLLLPSSTTASFVMLFTAYLAADGMFAILAAKRAPTQTRGRWSLMLEGLTNMAVALGVLIWPAIIVVPFLHLFSIWAVVTGALMLAAAHRLERTHGRWLLSFGGAVSTGWGVLLATIGPDATLEPRAMAMWLIAYAVVFGVTLLVLGIYLRRRHREATTRIEYTMGGDGGLTSGAGQP